ncbi:MAG TPA: agmatinase [Armatimonadota bacterium]|jgi:agmatinase
MILQPSPYPFLASEFGCTGQVTLLGAPLDRTGSFRPGSAEGPTGIRWASENLETYSPYLDRDLEDLRVGDLGDLDFLGLSQQEAVDLIEREVGVLLDADSIPLVLGGEHTIALPIARAVMRRYPDAMVLHFDAHADLRDSYEGEALSHAAWAYHVGQEFGFDRLVQLGIRSGLREEFQLGRARSAFFSMGLEIPHDIRVLLSQRPVYISLDIDVLDSSIVPGTGTPEAGGATFRELLTCLQSLAFMRVVAMDLNEVAPPLDSTGASSAVAAKLAREMILLFARQSA